MTAKIIKETESNSRQRLAVCMNYFKSETGKLNPTLRDKFIYSVIQAMWLAHDCKLDLFVRNNKDKLLFEAIINNYQNLHRLSQSHVDQLYKIDQRNGRPLFSVYGPKWVESMNRLALNEQES